MQWVRPSWHICRLSTVFGLLWKVTVEEFTLYGEAGLASTQPRGITSPEFKDGSPHVSMTAGEALAQNTAVQAEGSSFKATPKQVGTSLHVSDNSVL